MIEEIVWMDAASGKTHMENLKEAVANRNGLEFFCRAKSYGDVIYEDDKGVVLLQSTNETGAVDYIAIPKGWIESRILLECK